MTMLLGLCRLLGTNTNVPTTLRIWIRIVSTRKNSVSSGAEKNATAVSFPISNFLHCIWFVPTVTLYWWLNSRTYLFWFDLESWIAALSHWIQSQSHWKVGTNGGIASTANNTRTMAASSSSWNKQSSTASSTSIIVCFNWWRMIMMLFILIWSSVGAATRPKTFSGQKFIIRQPQVQILSVFFYETFEHLLSQSIELIKSFPKLSRSHSKSYKEASYGHFTFYYWGRCGQDRGDGSTCLCWK